MQNFTWDNLYKSLCIYLSTYFDLNSMDRMSSVNKHWNKILSENEVKKKKTNHLEFKFKTSIKFHF